MRAWQAGAGAALLLAAAAVCAGEAAAQQTSGRRPTGRPSGAPMSLPRPGSSRPLNPTGNPGQAGAPRPSVPNNLPPGRGIWGAGQTRPGYAPSPRPAPSRPPLPGDPYCPPPPPPPPPVYCPPAAPVVVVAPGAYTGAYTGIGGARNVLIFPGYQSSLAAGYTVVSPFGPFYHCPAYIERKYVVTTPWAYLSGREVVPMNPWTDADSYVAADATRAGELRAALNDLTRFWENGDIHSLHRHLSDGEEIGVFHNGRYVYSLPRAEFSLLAADVLGGIETLAFRFTEVYRRDDGLLTAAARHQYRVRETGEMRSVPVRCTLRYRSGAWVLTGIWLAS